MKTAPLILFCFYSFCALSQDVSVRQKYDEKTIFLYGNQYMLNGQKLPKTSLSILLNGYPDPKTEYQLAKKWGSIGKVISFVSIALPLYGLYQHRENNRDLIPYGVASIATAYLSLPFTIRGKKHLHKSIWLYNKQVLIQ